MAGNDAVSVNPPVQGGVTANQHITSHGSDWLWAAFAVMLFSDLVVIGWHFFIPRGQRVFHQIGAIILTTASIAYFCLASDLGFANVATEFTRGVYTAGTYRQIWYVRYIDWVVTTPALLLELALASGLPLSDIITLCFFDEVMIIVGLVGALVASSYKWGFFVFGCVAEFYIWWVLAGPARSSAGFLGPEFKKSFTHSAIVLSILWLLYPVCWGLADGGSVISPDSEMIFYGVLDLLAKPVFLFIHLFSLSKLDFTRLQLSSGKFTSTSVGTLGHDAEKQARYVDNPPRMGAADLAVNGQQITPKKGIFGRKGGRDATATSPVAAGRPSEATAYSSS